MSAPQQALSSEALLAKAQAAVTLFGQKIRKQDCKLEEAIKLSDTMLQELRTGDLSPKQYYELNLHVVDELRYLQSWFIELEKKDKVKMVDLYQRVQYVPTVVPRLYLMCTVGAAYVSLSGSPAKEVMKDMLEMCKCVQHPMRGLFLRHYLSTLTKDKLKLLGGPKESCEFVLQNFSEMTRLWVRMQPPKPKLNSSDAQDPPLSEAELRKKQELLEKREIERKQLCQLIGVNLNRLSESVQDLDIYEHMVLPRVLDIIVASGDGFAQTYLSEIICQVFPSNFQIQTLEKYLETICGPDISPKTNILQIITTLTQRLGEEITKSPSDDNEDQLQVPSKQAVFETLFSAIKKLGPKYSFTERLAIFVQLLKFQAKLGGSVERVDSIFGAICDILAEEKIEVLDSNEEEPLVVDLLRAPLLESQNILQVLQLHRFPQLQNYLSFENRKLVAFQVLKSIVKSSEKVEDYSLASSLFDFLSPLLTKDSEQEDTGSNNTKEIDDYFARMIHKFHHENPNNLFEFFQLIKEKFMVLDKDYRISKVFVPLTFRNLELLRKPGFTQAREAFQLVHSLCSALGNSDNSPQVKDLGARMFIQAALCADKLNDETACYEFIVQAFTIYEEQADSKLQTALVPVIVGTVQTLTSLGKDNLDTLQAKTALYAVQLLKKSDQCRNVALSAHLFWSVVPERSLREGESLPIPGRNGKRTLECLQRALKTANECAVSSSTENKSLAIALFIEVLNQYIYFFQAGADKIKGQMMTELIALINEQMKKSGNVDVSVENFFRKTITHLRKLASKGGKFAEFAAPTGPNISSNFADPDNIM